MYSAPPSTSARAAPLTQGRVLERLLAAPDHTLNCCPAAGARRAAHDPGVGTGANAATVTAGRSPASATRRRRSGGRQRQVLRLPFGMLAAGRLRASAPLEKAQARPWPTSRLDPPVAAASPSGPVAFTNVRLYDAARSVPRRPGGGRRRGPDRRGRPARVGQGSRRRGGVRRPRQDARARPVGLPHARRRRLHGAQELSLGVTSVRDPGNNDPPRSSRARRAQATCSFPTSMPRR